MPRKNENILFVLSLLPWWVSATIAAVAFVGIVYVFPSMSIESPLWAFVKPLQVMATYFGILVAVVLLFPALVSYIIRHTSIALARSDCWIANRISSPFET